jgi:hypothetical protein
MLYAKQFVDIKIVADILEDREKERNKVMVERPTQTKTSSLAQGSRTGGYAFSHTIEAAWRAPKPSELRIEFIQHNIYEKVWDYQIKGIFAEGKVNPVRWKTPPHRYLLNAPIASTTEQMTEIIEPRAMLDFARRYGPLFTTPESGVGHAFAKEESWTQFVVSSRSLEAIPEERAWDEKDLFTNMAHAHSLALLRFAWRSGHKLALEAISESAGQHLRVRIDVASGVVATGAEDAWSFVCMLVLRDRAAGRTGICANPDCPAPYFLKSRKTQRICEEGACVSWAQRSYALKWWRNHESKASKGSR